MMEPPNPTRLKHLLDQLEATLVDVAPVLINYHDKLVEGDIPAELVWTLIRDVQTYMFCGTDLHG